MSCSPGRSCVRRHTIFNQQRRNMAKSELTRMQASATSLPNTYISMGSLEQIRRQILTLCQRQTEMLIQEINSNQAKIQQLEQRLAANEQQLFMKKRQLEAYELRPGFNRQQIENMVSTQLSAKLQKIGQRFSELEELVAQYLFGVEKSKSSNNILNREISEILPATVDLTPLRQSMDTRLRQILDENKMYGYQMKSLCNGMNEQINCLEAGAQRLYGLVKSIFFKTDKCQHDLHSLSLKVTEAQKMIKFKELPMRMDQGLNFYSFEQSVLQQEKIQYTKHKEFMSPFDTNLLNQPSNINTSQQTIVFSKTRGVEERLKDVIRRKNIPTPIRSFLDDQNYLRKRDGAYMFDLDGDMFKMSPSDFRRFCSMRLLINHD